MYDRLYKFIKYNFAKLYELLRFNASLYKQIRNIHLHFIISINIYLRAQVVVKVTLLWKINEYKRSVGP